MHVAYLCMARTTLVLDDNLFRQMKKKAASEGRTLQAVANELLRRALTQSDRQTYRLKDTAQAHRDLEGRKTTGSTLLLP